jgi:hypothetical protein
LHGTEWQELEEKLTFKIFIFISFCSFPVEPVLTTVVSFFIIFKLPVSEHITKWGGVAVPLSTHTWNVLFFEFQMGYQLS